MAGEFGCERVTARPCVASRGLRSKGMLGEFGNERTAAAVALLTSTSCHALPLELRRIVWPAVDMLNVPKFLAALTFGSDAGHR